MQKVLFLISFVSIVLYSQAETVNISGVAPGYIGKSVQAYAIQDYLSMVEFKVASSTVKADSTFHLSFDCEGTQKIILKSENNKGFLLVQPGASYSIFLPEKDAYTPYKPSGNEVEIGFFELDSTDINYKVLGFQRWVDNFIGNNYHLKSAEGLKFSEALDRFKGNVEKAYAKDEDVYFKMYVRFAIAGLDNINHVASRNRYEKYDFYLKQTKLQYQNESYMGYVNDFYERMTPRLPNETNEAVYKGVLHSSPTLIMKALGTEYTMSNLQLRELIMMKMLTEEYNSGRFPKTNILTIMDSLSNGALFKVHRTIAHNLTDRLTELVPGGEAPNIVLMQEGKPTKTLKDFTDKHVYIQFIDPNSERNMMEVELLKELHSKYSSYVHFITLYKSSLNPDQATLEKLNALPWDVYGLPETNAVWKKYSIKNYPQYTLLDVAGYIVASPSLSPTPNGQYETIDKTFFYIKKAVEIGQ